MTDPLSSRANQYLYMGAIVALIAIGATIRAWGVLINPLDLWADEAWWAELLETRGLTELGIRPVGYMWINRQLLAWGDPAVMLRLISLAAGIGALYFQYRSAELLLKSRIAVLFVLLLAAFHPNLIVFAKEFKPFSLEVFVFSALTWGSLAALRKGRPGTGFWGAAVVSLPFSYPVVFLYPALALAFFGERLARLRRFAWPRLVIGALIVVPLLFLLHMLAYDWLDAARSRHFWGNKYGLFPLERGWLGGFAWYGEKSWNLLARPGALDAMPPFALHLFALAAIGGVASLWAAMRLRELALLLVPVLTVALANLLGYWPYGPFRANLFLIPGTLLLIGLAVDWVALRPYLRSAAYAAAAGALLAVLAHDPASYRRKSMANWAPSPQLTEVLDAIEDRRDSSANAGANVIIADWHSWRPIAFYLRQYPALRDSVRLVRGPLADLQRLADLVAMEAERAALEPRATRLWIVATRLNPHRAIREDVVVQRHAVYRREFALHDRNYHPMLIELRLPGAREQ
ncbi:MAG: hypothetical protein WD793_01895 [Steroidobacteraceae bacterium]